MRYKHPNLLLRRYHLKRLIAVVTTIRQVAKTGNSRKRNCLDVGCGDGTYERVLENDFDYMVGLDISLHNLKIAKEQVKNKHRIDFVQADAHYLPFKGSSFDIVLCSEVLEHLRDPSKALTELVRTFRDMLLITVSTLSTLRNIAKIFSYNSKLRRIDEQVGHVHMHSPSWWVRLIFHVINRTRKPCAIRIIYRYLSAEPFATIFSRCRSASVFKTIDKSLDLIEKVFSRPMFANNIVIVILDKHFQDDHELYSEEAGIRMTGVTDEDGIVVFTVPAIGLRNFFLWAYVPELSGTDEIVFLRYARTLCAARIDLS